MWKRLVSELVCVCVCRLRTIHIICLLAFLIALLRSAASHSHTAFFSYTRLLLNTGGIGEEKMTILCI